MTELGFCVLSSPFPFFWLLSSPLCQRARRVSDPTSHGFLRRCMLSAIPISDRKKATAWVLGQSPERLFFLSCGCQWYSFCVWLLVLSLSNSVGSCFLALRWHLSCIVSLWGNTATRCVLRNGTAQRPSKTLTEFFSNNEKKKATLRTSRTRPL